eukprot:TRINITY_DN13034_c0_g2_i1.p1 TRINITY_DN13034_c0_g2~~TRINITY_DN13034_c0_g2_i1.p1  ORF type:complete len:290 (-),score=72.21 TRINITY_DN13034_c0_g2_i1:71-940(-)
MIGQEEFQQYMQDQQAYFESEKQKICTQKDKEVESLQMQVFENEQHAYKNIEQLRTENLDLKAQIKNYQNQSGMTINQLQQQLNEREGMAKSFTQQIEQLHKELDLEKQQSKQIQQKEMETKSKYQELKEKENNELLKKVGKMEVYELQAEEYKNKYEACLKSKQQSENELKEATFQLSQLSQQLEKIDSLHRNEIEELKYKVKETSKAVLEQELMQLNNQYNQEKNQLQEKFFQEKAQRDQFENKAALYAVSYTHLTLPTKRIVQISMVVVSLKKNERASRRQSMQMW